MSMYLRFFAPVTLACLLAACAGGQGDAAEQGDKVSALVTTQPTRHGSLPEIVSAYGTAAPALDAATTLSVQAEGSVEHFEVAAGAVVKRGQPLLSFALAPAVVATYRQAQTAWELARTQRVHTEQLLSQQLATRDQLAQADKALSDARSTLDALRKQQGDEAVFMLRAPYDGIVSTVVANQGDVLQAGAPLLAMARGDGVVVSVGIEPDAAHPVSVGDRANLVPLGSGATVSGVVKRVAGMLDAHTHLLDADIVPTGAVVVGAGYRADIAIGQWQGWLVPRDALVGDGDAWQVFQVADGKAVKVAVRIVGESDTVTVVSGELDPQRPLVVVGNTQLDDGMAVHSATAEPAK
ncbi:efflux RND transporter periplasmic adaptor subunit [Rhodanobacter sp. C05]|uniref:efflux RND transporter periplasmic adaptor subunit n=1 Tax=Rhodanobacter sp. C05 TaxID=1945855 RepID=UPI0009874901|nr:efflux RND transporter periplasmic adaptor subunit [Rhodanobacter sp. C05]